MLVCRIPARLTAPSAVFLERRNEFVVDVPREVDPFVLTEFLDTQIDDLAPHWLGVERGEIGLGQ